LFGIIWNIMVLPGLPCCLLMLLFTLQWKPMIVYKQCFYYLVIANSITPTLNELSAPHHSASQMLWESLHPSSSASPSENIVPNIYKVKRWLCLIWPCYLYSVTIQITTCLIGKCLLFCHLLGLVC